MAENWYEMQLKADARASRSEPRRVRHEQREGMRELLGRWWGSLASKAGRRRTPGLEAAYEEVRRAQAALADAELAFFAVKLKQAMEARDVARQSEEIERMVREQMGL